MTQYYSVIIFNIIIIIIMFNFIIFIINICFYIISSYLFGLHSALGSA